MKIYQIEVQKFKAASNNIHGQILFKVNALVSPKAEVEGIEPSTIIALTEPNARVLMALLKAQLQEFDGKKARRRF